jgi:hypothetical protein
MSRALIYFKEKEFESSPGSYIYFKEIENSHGTAGRRAAYGVHRGCSKTRQQKQSIWGHHKKMWLLFPPPPPPPPQLFCSISFYRVLGRFVTRGVQKRD